MNNVEVTLDSIFVSFFKNTGLLLNHLTAIRYYFRFIIFAKRLTTT